MGDVDGSALELLLQVRVCDGACGRCGVRRWAYACSVGEERLALGMAGHTQCVCVCVVDCLRVALRLR